MSDVFQFLTSDDLRLLAERAQNLNYAAGDVVLREGRIELQQDVYIIYKLVD